MQPTCFHRSLHKVMATGTISLLLGISTAHAGAIPYASGGTENPEQYTFTAMADGDLTAYFYGGTGAGFTNQFTALINGTASDAIGLGNHSSTYGQSLNLGHVNAGDSIVVQMVSQPGNGIVNWYSDASLNQDGANHVYATSFGGDATIPSGIYVAFEDMPKPGSDLNYNDLSVVLSNTVISSVPEPASLPLLLLGLSATIWRTRRQSSIS